METSATETLIELLGAVALLLWGTRMVRTGIMRAFGADLRHLLRVSLRNRFAAFAAGVGVTAILQSSTATALVVASFAGRGLVETAPALAMMLGADLGTTLVAQVLSLDIGWLAPLLIVTGVVIYLGAEATGQNELGRVALGLGLMLLALRLILGASAPMRGSTMLGELFGALAHEMLILVLVAALLTWLAHSSLAVVLLVMSLASVAALPLQAACVLVVGANVGATLPALTASFAEGPAARRVTVGNLLFKIAGAVLVLPVIAVVVPLLQQLEAAPGRVVVDFHTGFNLALGVLFILLTDVVGRLCVRLMPDQPAENDPGRPRHLDRSTMGSPGLALACAAREALRMGDLIETMLRDSFDALRRGDRQKVAWTAQLDDHVDHLHEAIKLFVIEVSREPLSHSESRRASEIHAITTNLEHIGDIIDKSVLELAEKKIRLQLRFSHEGWEEIRALHARVLDNLQMALGVFMSGDVAIARKLIDEKVAMRDAERQAAENHLARLRAGRPESIDSSALHLDLLRDLKRIHSHICAIAYPLLDEADQLYRSRLKRVERRAQAEAEAPPCAAARAAELPEAVRPPASEPRQAPEAAQPDEAPEPPERDEAPKHRAVSR